MLSEGSMNTELLTVGTLVPQEVRAEKATRWERSSIAKTGVTLIFTISLGRGEVLG